MCDRYEAMGFGQMCPCVHKDGVCMSMIEQEPRSSVGRTKQSFREEVDINRIVARARAGQAVTHLARGVPQYLDVSEVGDYKGALDMLRSTEAWFARLPSALRREFGNDPAQFLDGMETPEGRAILEGYGAPKAPEVVPVPPREAPGVRSHTHDAGEVATPPA